MAGVDEAARARLRAGRRGRGISSPNFPRGIDDSKKLPIAAREAIFGRLQKVARIGVGMASVEEIDEINIYWARMLAMSRAVEALGLEPAWVLVDGNACPRWQRPSKAIVDGDAKCRSIAAASIIAKVTRDRLMARLAVEHPGYGWETNRGYPTPPHRRALRELGLTPHHRRSFGLVREILDRDAQSELAFDESAGVESSEPHHHVLSPRQPLTQHLVVKSVTGSFRSPV